MIRDACFAPELADELVSAWGAEPRVFRNVLREPVFTARDFMAAIAGAAADYVADPTTRFGRIFVAGEIVKPEQIPSFVPAHATDDFDAYLARVTSIHPEFSFIVSACEKYVPAIRERFTPLLHRLFAQVGYPVRAHMGCIYSGTYKTTPFGIHTDQCHVLMCCGVGRKTMAFWPRQYFEPMRMLFVDNKVKVRIADHLEHATQIEIGPQDLLYWPANTWHVGVNDRGDFSAALSLGIYHRASSARMFNALDFLPSRGEQLLPEIEQYDRFDLNGFGPFPLPHGRLSPTQLYATTLVGFFDHWHHVRDALNTPEEAEYRALRFVLASLSSAGFGTRYDANGETLTPMPGTRLRCTAADALVMASAREGLLVGADGQLFFYTQHVDRISALLTRLREGTVIGYDEVLASADGARDALATVIRDLAAAGVLAAERAAGEGS